MVVQRLEPQAHLIGLEVERPRPPTHGLELLLRRVAVLAEALELLAPGPYCVHLVLVVMTQRVENAVEAACSFRPRPRDG